MLPLVFILMAREGMFITSLESGPTIVALTTGEAGSFFEMEVEYLAIAEPVTQLLIEGMGRER